ncbi:MAG: hypothetical protein SFX18_14370 [Pirellulales bacterium]|nr:hypothetical protein [Pirellulales bacterium]
MMRVLWGCKIGKPDWHERIITSYSDRIEAARAWALANGYDRLRVAEYPGDPDPGESFRAQIAEMMRKKT